MKLASVGGFDIDAMTLDQFIGLLGKLDLLRMWRSEDQRVQNALSIHTMEREMAIMKAAGVAMFDEPSD